MPDGFSGSTLEIHLRDAPAITPEQELALLQTIARESQRIAKEFGADGAVLIKVAASVGLQEQPS